MNPVMAVKSYFKKYANFSGRASRSEFWFVMLFLILGFLFLSVVSSLLSNVLFATVLNNPDTLGLAYFLLGVNPIVFIASLALLLPTLALTVRRLHDVNMNGGLLALALVPFIGPLIVLVLTILPGTYGPNRYGELVY